MDSNAGIIAGHGRLLAARKLGLAEVPVVVLDHLSETQRRAYIIADNKLALNAGWDETVLAAELRDLEDDGLDLALVGFSDDELEALLAGKTSRSRRRTSKRTVPEAPAQPVTRPGDVWSIGKHRLICGDCRDLAVVEQLFGRRARERGDHVAAVRDAARVRPVERLQAGPAGRVRGLVSGRGGRTSQSVLAPDGSYFLNIKEHADDGERSLYVKDLVIAHRRQWGWRFVDEFCWRKTDNGVPGGWNNRFKNAWEPVFHFCRQQQIKFRPKRVGHESEDCFDYSPEQPEVDSPGADCWAPARAAARPAKPGATDADGRYAGVARP